MYSVQNISVHFGGDPLFRNVSFIINQKDRIGLTGKNGSGKTTLLNIMNGSFKPDEGDVIIPDNRMVGYLPQEMALHNHRTVLDEAMTAFKEVKEIEEKLRKLNDEISERTDYQSKHYQALLMRVVELNDKHRILGGHALEEGVERVLAGLGFRRTDFDRPLDQFSNGWQMRVEIAKILLRKPDLLLLDEPTNHLDIESIQWLEDFLREYPGAVVIVSHDRAFLDNVTERTVEIEMGRIYDYKVSYSDYVLQREIRMESQMAAFNNQQRQVRQIERFIERFRYKNTKSRQVQSRIKMLEKMEEIQIDEMDKTSIQFRFPPAPASGKIVVQGQKLVKKYGRNTVLDGIDFAIIRGERVAFVGKNGEGKTTLSRILAGMLEFDGELKPGHNVIIGYYAQNPSEMLDPEYTVFETIDKVAVGDIRPKIRTLLGGFLFGGEDIDKKVKVLSGGEKARLALAKLLLTPANFLILDEPTNHLDMQSKDILKSALIQYDGTLVLVSHDRDFLQGLTTKVFEFREKKIREYPGDVYDFLEARKMSTLRQLEQDGKKTGDGLAAKTPSVNKVVYEKKKEVEREWRRVSNQLQKCETDISRVEGKLQGMDRLMSEPDNLSGDLADAGIYDDYARLKGELGQLMTKWENLSLEQEELERQRKDLQ